MKIQLRLTVLIGALILQFALVAHGQEPASINELRSQIQRLTEINNDPNTDPEVKKINRTFLEKRRRQLATLLQEKLITLQSYQAKVDDVLSVAEREVLAQAAHDLETELHALDNANPTTQAHGSPVSNPPGDITSNLQANGVPVPETSNDSVENSEAAGRATRLAAKPAATSTGTRSADSATPVANGAPEPTVVAPPADFNNWLDNRIKDRIKAVAQARIDQRSNVNQTEAPSISDNSTSLVDQSSASDLIGVALNLSGLGAGTNTSDKDKNSAAVTATAYSLYSALKGEQPLDPSFYNRHRNWRRLSFTLGFEKGQTDAQGQTTEDTTIAGAKYLIIAGRDAAKHQDELNKVYEYLKAAAVNFAQLNKEIRNALLFGDPALRDKLRIVEEANAYANNPVDLEPLSAGRKQALKDLMNEPVESWFDPEKTDFARLAIRTFLQNKYFTADGLPLFLKALDDEGLKQIDQLIDARLDAFTNLNNASRRAIEKIRRAPQFSLSFQSKLKKEGTDEFTGEAVFDYGVHDRVNLTLNGGYFYKNSKIIGGDLRGANFAGQLQFQLTPEKSLAGRSPLYFYLASEGNWMSGSPFVYKLQGKVKVPIAEGIEFPISLTYASRKDLVNEKDVRGQFGFTFDTAKLLRALLTR